MTGRGGVNVSRNLTNDAGKLGKHSEAAKIEKL